MKDKIESFNQDGYYPDACKTHSNDNWVCLECCETFRYSKLVSHDPKCTKCKSVLYNFGSQFEAPRKTDKKKWKELKNSTKR